MRLLFWRLPEDHVGRHQLEHCLETAGFGRYNIKIFLVLALAHIAACLELFGYSLVLPSAKCDLDMSDEQRGYVASIPHLGILLTAYVHGYLVDVKGRKKMIVYCCLLAGCLSSIAAFMPNLISFCVFKFLTSLCIGVPSITPYTLLGEIMPYEYRGLMMTTMNALMLIGSSLVPILAWIILPLDFRIPIGSIVFRPWRLLCLAYASIFIISGILLSFGPESPKFLLCHGKTDASLKVLKRIYAGNTKRPPDDYPIRTLFPPPRLEPPDFRTSIKVHTLPLFRWKYFKYLLLNGCLLFGVYAVMNGLYSWAADVMNRVLVEDGAGKTACQIIMEGNDKTTSTDKCDDSIDTTVFMIKTTAQLSCGITAFAVSFIVKIIGSKILLIACFYLIATFIMILNNTTEYVVFAVLISSFPLLVLCTGPINAYNVQIFPTEFRGMALCLCVMLGRLGSINSSIMTGTYINVACKELFYAYGALLYVCGTLALLHKNR